MSGGAGASARSKAIERFEILATVLLALATVATAWSSYQAARWNGEQAKAAARSNAMRIESTKSGDRANTQTEVDVIVFTQWLDAYAQNDTERADFYRARFRDEFQPAFEAWLASQPLQNPDVPQTPFAREEYVLAARTEADQLNAQSEEFASRALRNIQRSSNYILCVVLFAATLFFAGSSTRLESRGVRRAVLAIGLVLFLGTIAWIATFPVSFEV